MLSVTSFLVGLLVASLSSFGFGFVGTGGCRLRFWVPFGCVAFCLEFSALGVCSCRSRLWVVFVVCSTPTAGCVIIYSATEQTEDARQSELEKCRDELLSHLPTDQWILLPSQNKKRIANTVRSLHEFILLDDKVECWCALQGTSVLSRLPSSCATILPRWSGDAATWCAFLAPAHVWVDKFQGNKSIMIVKPTSIQMTWLTNRIYMSQCLRMDRLLFAMLQSICES